MVDVRWLRLGHLGGGRGEGKGGEERARRKREKEGGLECDLRGMKRGGIRCLKLYFFSMTHHAPTIALSVS